MTVSAPTSGFVNSVEFTENFNAMPEEVWRPYLDQYVAYSLDGRQILAAGATYPELFANMALMGIERSEVVFGFVE